MFKTILVPMTGIEGDRVVLETAWLLATGFGAHLECLHTRANALNMAINAATFDAGNSAIVTEQLWEALEEEEKERSALAQRMFAAFCQSKGLAVAETPGTRAGASGFFREAEGNTARETIGLARLHDLTVVGRSLEPRLDTAAIGEILVASGRPLLIAPRRAPSVLGKTIVVAWKDTSEAAHAVDAAMPLLSSAKEVVVVVAAEGSNDTRSAEAAAQRLVSSLAWHDIPAKARALTAQDGDVHATMLRCVAETGADLLVMGGYGHSRLRELVFGGFTRSVLNEAGLPVLLAH